MVANLHSGTAKMQYKDEEKKKKKKPTPDKTCELNGLTTFKKFFFSSKIKVISGKNIFGTLLVLVE